MSRVAVLVLSLALLVQPGTASAWKGLDIPDLRGTWVIEMSTLAGDAFPPKVIEITAYDDSTGVFSGETRVDGTVVATLTGTRANEQATMRIDFPEQGSWSNLRGVFSLKPRLHISGAYTVDRENLADGDFDGIFDLRMKKAAAVDPAGQVVGGAETTAPSAVETTVADEDDGDAASEEPQSTNTGDGAPVTGSDASACHLSRVQAAKAAFEAQTPYASTLALNAYQGADDELSFGLLISERVEDPGTWDRVTAIPAEDGWSIFETRRLGERVWQRIDGGAWTADPPDEDVLGTPWPLDIVGRQLLPGGQAAEPALISSYVGNECVISLLFRTEDGGKGEGRFARLIFSGDEVLPRSIEFLRTLAPRARSKKTGPSRPGDTYSLVMTIEAGAVESVVAPIEGEEEIAAPG